MSTHRHSLRGLRNTQVPLLLIGCGLLLALQLCLASVAFASSVGTIAPLPSSTPTAPSNQGFALARVSVVRLLVSYTSNGNALANCTGLGVLVKSLPGNGPNDVVLTDSS